MRILHLSAFALVIPAFVGCKAIDAMDATGAMKTDLAAMKATTTGMAGTTEEMKNTTNELKRKASLGEGLKLFDAPENNQEFVPPSAGLLAGAKLIAENMTARELLDFTVVRLKEINSTMPREVERDRRLVGEFSPQYVDEYNRSKMVKVVGLKAIAAQIPQSTLDRIVQEQLRGSGGPRSDEAFVLLTLRASFIDDFFLGNTLFAAGRKIDTLGKLELVLQYVKQMKDVEEIASDSNARDAEKFVFKTSEAEGVFLPEVFPAEKLPGEEGCETAEDQRGNDACKPTLGSAPSFNEKLNLSRSKHWFRKIVSAIDSDMPEQVRGGDGDARRVAEIRAEAERLGAEEARQ